MRNDSNIRNNVQWLLALCCFACAPVFTRVALGIEQHFHQIDLMGFLSDFMVSLVAVFIFFLLLKLSRFLALPFLVLWLLFHYSNYEHVGINGDLVSLLYVKYIFSPTFLMGSGLVVSNYLLLFAVFLGSFLVYTIKPVKFTKSVVVTTILLFGVLLFTTVTGASVLDRRWRANNVVSANTIDLFAINYTDYKKAPLDSLLYRKLVKQDLAGEKQVPYHKGRRPKNVLIVVVEGVTGGALPSVRKHHDVSWDISLPLLDSIASDNISYRNFISHQRQTNRGLFSIFSGSYPKLNSTTPKMTEYISFPNRETLPRFLSKRGYRTVYMQASPLPYMLKDIFMKKAGFDEIYGRDWFKYHYSTRYWGVDDKSFFEQAAAHIESFSGKVEPWFMTMLTVGTHHPLDNIPENYRVIPGESNKQRIYSYLDEALQSFFARLKDKGILENTLVLVTSDEAQAVKAYETSSGERLSEQWGMLTVLHPSGKQKVFTDKYCQRDLALSVIDYLGMNTEEAPFEGRSVFRSYTSGRDIYFSNTYGHVTGRFTANNELDVCTENLSHCEKYSVESGKLFANHRDFLRVLSSEEKDDFARLAWMSNNDIAGFDTARSIEFNFYSGRIRPIKMGHQENILAGQFFTLPENTEVTVSLKGRILKGKKSNVYIKHDIYGKAEKSKVVKYVYNTLSPGEEFSTTYQFYNTRNWYHTEFRVTAEVVKGTNAKLIIDEALLKYTRRSASPEERKAAMVRFEREVGRDLGAHLVVKPVASDLKIAHGHSNN
ncbi:MAG: LTA synthase family protein [Fibrobacteria bacterium]|nr:LTA synthase family protein [Fibrobacteria bacterium]